MPASETMWAAVLHAVGDLRWERVAVPRPGPGEALVRVRASGVCGSDVARVFVHGAYRFPLIPGHEFAGEVATLRSDAQGVAAGARVAVQPLIPCEKCRWCAAGEHALCDDYDYLGSRRDGGWAEYAVASVANLAPIPEGVSFEAVAMTEPAAVALHGLDRAGLRSGESIAIFGAGPVGLMLAQMARAQGASPIVLVDVGERKIAAARGLGFEHVIDASGADPVAAIREIAGGGADVCVEGVGLPRTFRQAAAAARKLGRVLLLGNMRGEVTLAEPEFSHLLRRQLTLMGTWNSRIRPAGDNDWTRALAMMADGRLQVEPLITHRLAPDRVVEALEMMREGKEFFNKVMMVFQ